MILELRQLCKRYRHVQALRGLNLSVPEGGVFAFLGPNGAGKTTTIRIVNGLTSYDSGEVRIVGRDLTDDSRATRRLCGLAAQAINLDGELTVAENLEFHGRLYGMPRTERRVAADHLLNYVDMSGRADSLVKTLSGGMKRRVMIARALMHSPRLLFLDEPTAGLDPAIRRRIWSLVKRVSQDGTTVFLTTHYIEEAEFLADRAAFVHQGQVVATGVPATLMAGLGSWAVDVYGKNGMDTRHFTTRQDAEEWMYRAGSQATIRRSSLEDVYLTMTGRREQ